tara:strand:+ start:173 stop:490 length:318 start_codon:yes stop_codon:yes gene_type:complete
MIKQFRPSMVNAILAINPEAQVTIHGNDYDTIDWNVGTPIIAKADIDAKLIELNAEYDEQEYARSRALAYPSIGDQLDMIYKDMKNGTSTHADAVEVVKTKYPKG